MLTASTLKELYEDVQNFPELVFKHLPTQYCFYVTNKNCTILAHTEYLSSCLVPILSCKLEETLPISTIMDKSC